MGHQTDNQAKTPTQVGFTNFSVLVKSHFGTQTQPKLSTTLQTSSSSNLDISNHIPSTQLIANKEAFLYGSKKGCNLIVFQICVNGSATLFFVFMSNKCSG